MSLEYSLCPQSTVCVPRVQFMSLECRIFPQSTVYILISKLYSLIPSLVLICERTIDFYTLLVSYTL